MRNPLPLPLVQVSCYQKRKKENLHSLEFASDRKIDSLYFWGVREERARIRLTLLTSLVWSGLHSAKIKSQFGFVFPSRVRVPSQLFLTMLLLKSAFPSFQFCPQCGWKGTHRHIWDTNHRKGAMMLSFQKTKTKAPESKATPLTI